MRAKAMAFNTVVDKAWPWSLEDVTRTSPTTVPAQVEEHWRALLGLLKPTDIIWIGQPTDSCDDDAKSHRKARCQRHFQPVCEFVKLPSPAKFNFISQCTFKTGTYHRGDESVVHRPFIVLEIDKKADGAPFTVAEQLSRIRWCSQFLTLRAIVSSGGKSFHAWFDLPDQEIFGELKLIAPALGFDPATLRATQPVRLPGAWRHDGGPDKKGAWQSLLWLDTGAHAVRFTRPSALLEATSPVTTTAAVATDTIEAKRARIGKVWEARDLQTADLPEVEWIVEQIMTAGVTVLAAGPKTGKTLMMVNMAIDIASGYATLGGKVETTAGELLLLLLENSSNEVKELLVKLHEEPLPAGIHIITLSEGFESFDRGGFEKLAVCLDVYPLTKVVVIDTWAKVKPTPRRHLNSYESDTAALAPLQALAKQRGIAVVIITHLRKEPSTDDVFKEITGSIGTMAVADTVLVLKRGRGEEEATMHVTGRFTADKRLAMRFDPNTLHWTLLGDASEFNRSQRRQQLLDVIREAVQPPTPKEVHDLLRDRGEKISYSTVKVLLRKMEAAGDVGSKEGRYTANDPAKVCKGSAAPTTITATATDGLQANGGGVNPVNPVNPTTHPTDNEQIAWFTAVDSAHKPCKPDGEGDGFTVYDDTERKPGAVNPVSSDAPVGSERRFTRFTVSPPTNNGNGECMCWLAHDDGEHAPTCRNNQIIIIIRKK